MAQGDWGGFWGHRWGGAPWHKGFGDTERGCPVAQGIWGHTQRGVPRGTGVLGTQKGGGSIAHEIWGHAEWGCHMAQGIWGHRRGVPCGTGNLGTYGVGMSHGTGDSGTQKEGAPWHRVLGTHTKGVPHGTAGTGATESPPGAHLDLVVEILLVVGVEEVGDAEVGHLGLAGRLEQHVAGGQVAVHHAVLLQVVHPLRGGVSGAGGSRGGHTKGRGATPGPGALTLATCTHQLSSSWGLMPSRFLRT